MYVINEEKVLFTQLGDEGVLFNVESNEYFSTNDTFTKIVLGIQNEMSVDQIVENLLEEFDIDADACRKSVENSINILQEKGFIE